MQVYHVIGLMSGTSLDGVDLAYCKFILTDKVWEYEIIQFAKAGGTKCTRNV